jgi:AcrR family transcriptional regulator
MSPSSRPRRTQAERTATTRAALLAAARALFAEQGFAGTTREDIGRRAGVTHGALYHHFASKADVGAAVVAEIEAELVGQVVTAAAEDGTALDQLRAAARAYLDALADPVVATVLVDVTAAISGAAGRDASAACLPLLVAAVERLRSEGFPVLGPPEVAARLVYGMLNEAALAVAMAAPSDPLRQRTAAAVDTALTRLFS